MADPKQTSPMEHEAERFIVNTFEGPEHRQGRLLHSEIWDASTPLGIGHPLRYALERTPRGFRLRKLDLPSNKVVTNAFREFGMEELKGAKRVPLSHELDREGTKHFLIIHPIAKMPERPIIGEPSAIIIPAENPWEPRQDKLFRNFMVQVFGGLILLIVACLLLPPPKQNPEEIIPPQFAKILLSPAVKHKPTEDSKRNTKAGHENNLVKAFHSESLKRETKNLLSAGAITKLSRGNLLRGLGGKVSLDKVFSGGALSGTSGTGGLNALKALASGGRPTDIRLSGGNGKGGAYNALGAISVGNQGKGMVDLGGGGGMTVDDGLTKDEVGKVIRKHLGDVRYCYESALLRNPELEGKLVVSFSIDTAGAVKGAQVKEASEDAALNKCILDHLRGWRFPKPKGGVEVAVSYPFIFKSLAK